MAVVGVLVQAQVAHHDGVVAELVAERAIACWPTPVGFHASDPSASLRTGTPNSMNARTPASAVSTASLRSDSSVCWN